MLPDVLFLQRTCIGGGPLHSIGVGTCRHLWGLIRSVKGHWTNSSQTTPLSRAGELTGRCDTTDMAVVKRQMR